MGRARRAVLRGFGRAQRPLAWTILLLGLVTLVGVVSNVIATGQAKVASILAAVLVVAEGIGMAQEVENELESEGQATDGG